NDCAIDQDVDAPESVCDVGEAAPEACFVPDVRMAHHRGTSRRFDLAAQGFGRAPAAVVECGHASPFPRQGCGDRAADAGRTADDDGSPARERPCGSFVHALLKTRHAFEPPTANELVRTIPRSG